MACPAVMGRLDPELRGASLNLTSFSDAAADVYGFLPDSTRSPAPSALRVSLSSQEQQRVTPERECSMSRKAAHSPACRGVVSESRVLSWQGLELFALRGAQTVVGLELVALDPVAQAGSAFDSSRAISEIDRSPWPTSASAARTELHVIRPRQSARDRLRAVRRRLDSGVHETGELQCLSTTNNSIQLPITAGNDDVASEPVAAAISRPGATGELRRERKPPGGGLPNP
jgi:hypothetical protein